VFRAVGHPKSPLSGFAEYGGKVVAATVFVVDGHWSSLILGTAKLPSWGQQKRTVLASGWTWFNVL
jgi:hypothetical protein